MSDSEGVRSDPTLRKPPKCVVCDHPHRYSFPADLDGHVPSYVACVNTLLAVIDELESQPARELVVPSPQPAEGYVEYVKGPEGFEAVFHEAAVPSPLTPISLGDAS